MGDRRDGGSQVQVRRAIFYAVVRGARSSRCGGTGEAGEMRANPDPSPSPSPSPALTLTRWEHSGGCGVAALQDQWEASCDPAKKFTYTNPNPGYTAKVVMLEMIDP